MAMSGTPAMPWQRQAANLIGEINPETGLRRWPLVVISVPRQSGKTRLIGAAALQRALQAPKSFSWYTAQTGQHARRNWMKFTDDVLEQRCPLHPLFRRNKSKGDEALRIPRLGSTFCPHPPTEDSLHGEQGDLNIIDEGWAFDEVEGAALMQAITPTHATRPGAQTIIISTRGTSASSWFHGMIANIKNGELNAALIDYGIADDVDPSDLAAVAAAHPAYGHTQTMASFESAWAEMGGSVSEFARAYGNRETAAKSRYIPIEAWEMATTTTPIPPTARVIFTTAVSADREESVIVAAAHVAGIPQFEIVECRPGYSWVPARLAELVGTHGGQVYYDPLGSSDVLRQEMEKATAFTAVEIKTRELTAACGNLFTRLKNTDENGMCSPEVRFYSHPKFDAAAELAVPRRLGDSWAWDRRSVVGSIAPIEAATLGLHALGDWVETMPMDVYVPDL